MRQLTFLGKNKVAWQEAPEAYLEQAAKLVLHRKRLSQTSLHEILPE